MQLDLSENFMKPGKETTLSYEPELSESFRDGTACSLKAGQKPVIEFRFVTTEKGHVLMTAKGELLFEAPCDRCLTPVDVPIRIDLERELTGPEAEKSEDPEEDESTEDLEGHSLDAEALLLKEISLAWPMKILCREDCKGLCPVCGANRNEKQCGCDTFVPDPRMAGIMDLFNQAGNNGKAVE